MYTCTVLVRRASACVESRVMLESCDVSVRVSVCIRNLSRSVACYAPRYHRCLLPRHHVHLRHVRSITAARTALACMKSPACRLSSLSIASTSRHFLALSASAVMRSLLIPNIRACARRASGGVPISSDRALPALFLRSSCALPALFLRRLMRHTAHDAAWPSGCRHAHATRHSSQRGRRGATALRRRAWRGAPCVATRPT